MTEPVDYKLPGTALFPTASQETDFDNLLSNRLNNLSETIRWGQGNQVFILDEDGLRMGAATFADAPFHVDFDGNVGGTGLAVNSIDIGGSDATSFHVDTSGNMWSGDATFANAPAKISNSGDATFSSVTLTGSGAQILAADVTRSIWVHCYGDSEGTSGTTRITAGSQPACGFSDDSTTPTILFHSNGTSGTRWWKMLYESTGDAPYFVESSTAGSIDSDGGSVAIGADEWWADSTNIFKNGSIVTISGTAPSSDPVLGHDPTNSYLLVQDSSTRIRRYSGVSGTTITNINSDITLDNAVDTNKGFIYDNTNSRYIFVDGTNLRRFNSSGTTIDTAALPTVTGLTIQGLCFINDRVYLITGYAHIEFQTSTVEKRDIMDAQFIPTSMTR